MGEDPDQFEFYRDRMLGDPVPGRVVVKGFSNARVLDRLLRYERRIEHNLYRAMAELQGLRLLRELDRPMEKEKLTPRPAGVGGDGLLRQTEPTLVPGRQWARAPYDVTKEAAVPDEANLHRQAGAGRSAQFAGRRCDHPATMTPCPARWC